MNQLKPYLDVYSSVRTVARELLSLNIQQLGALSIFASYFTAIICLFSVVFKSIELTSKTSTGLERTAEQRMVFWVLTAISFEHTWYYMFKYMGWSFQNYEAQAPTVASGFLARLTNWLINTGLFEEAWGAVSFGKMNWWWSEQLCLYTVGAWTVFLYTEGSRYKIKHVWAYMLLGQLVAISVASNLFYIAVLSASSTSTRTYTPPSPSTSVPLKVWASILVALSTIPLSPFTSLSNNTFLLNLLVMHALIALPLFFVSPPKKATGFWNLSTFYLVLFLLVIPIRSRTISEASASLLSSSPESSQSPLVLVKAAWATLYSHPAQSSIGWDIVWTTFSFVVWMLYGSGQANGRLRTAYLTLAMPLVSVGVAAPYTLRPREEARSEEVEKDK